MNNLKGRSDYISLYFLLYNILVMSLFIVKLPMGDTVNSYKCAFYMILIFVFELTNTSIFMSQL